MCAFTIKTCALAFGAVCAIAAVCLSGDLTPPPGPVAPTMKTLVEVEPRIIVNGVNTPGDADSMFQITAPGSYYLIGNITGVFGLAGIEIDSDGVTLDLMGFHMNGVAGSLAGVSVPVPHENICIRNGSLCGWGDEGVGAFLATNSELHDLRACGNGLSGLVVGPGSTVRDCTGESNGGSGVFAGTHSTVRGCVGRMNATYGVAATSVATVSVCAAYQNGDSGIAAGFGSTISFCVAEQNGGFAPVSRSEKLRVEAVAQRDLLLESLGRGRDGKRGVAPFDAGILGGGGSTITGCSAVRNTGNGIEMAGTGGTIISSTSTLNTDNGIFAGFGTHVLDCKAHLNIDDGIEVGTQCVVARNFCSGNDDDGDFVGAGIHAALDANHIEGNNVTDNAVGVLVDIGGNLIMQNRATLNPGGGYVIAVGNAAAPIVPVVGVDPFIGVDPNANLDY